MNQRLTLIVLGPAPIQREWSSIPQTSGLLFLDSLSALDEFLGHEAELDIERVVLESGSAAASQFLSLLAGRGTQFSGDLLFVAFDESGFLSSIGRGGDRVLYELSSDDVDFYLLAHKLVVPELSGQMSGPIADWVADAQFAMTA